MTTVRIHMDLYFMINNTYAIVEQYMLRQTKDHLETINIVDFSILKVNTRKQNIVEIKVLFQNFNTK